MLGGKRYKCVDLAISRYGNDITMGDFGDGFSRLTPDGGAFARNISMLQPGQRCGTAPPPCRTAGTLTTPPGVPPRAGRPAPARRRVTSVLDALVSPPLAEPLQLDS